MYHPQHENAMRPIRVLLCSLAMFMLIPKPCLSQAFFDTVSVKSVGPGMTHYHIVAPAIPWNIHVLTVDATNPYVTFETAKASDQLVGLEGVSSMVSRKSSPGHDAVGAINGDFYILGNGTPTNIQIAQGEVLLNPIARPAFGFDADNSPVIDVVSLSIKVYIEDTVATVHGANASRGTDQLILYNSYKGASTGTNQFGTEALVHPLSAWTVNDTIVCVVDSVVAGVGNMQIPDGYGVLSGHGLSNSAVMSKIQAEDTIRIYQGVSPGPPNLNELIGGNPKLVVNGIDVSPAAPREPRTAAGFSADSSLIYLITVDGRQGGFSVGMTFTELAQFMLQIGVYQGVNLDGGGSTTMVIRNQIMNSPSDGSERAVSNAMLVISSAPFGTLSDVSISPKNPRVFRRSSKQFQAFGMDEYGNPDTLANGVARFSCDPEIGTIDSLTGFFTAADTTAVGSVILRYNSWADTARVVVKRVGSVNILPEDIVTDTTRAIAFTAISTDTDNLVQPIPAEEYAWSVTNPVVGNVSSTGVFQGLSEGTTGVVAEMDGHTDTSWVNVEIGSGYLQLDDLEDLSNWTPSVVDIDSISVTIVDSVTTSGTSSVRIFYDFTATAASYLYLDGNMTLYGVPDSVIIDGRTETHSHRLYYIVQDDNGEEFRLYSSKLMNKIGILDTIRAPISPNQALTPGASLHFPLTLKRIEVQLVYNRTLSNRYTGTLFLDNLRVSYPNKLTTSVKQVEGSVPSEFRLLQNYPNPFNGIVNFGFRIADWGDVTLKVYDILGREVAILLNERKGPGEYRLQWDSGGLPSGVYYYSITAGVFSQVRKMVLVR